MVAAAARFQRELDTSAPAAKPDVKRMKSRRSGERNSSEDIRILQAKGNQLQVIKPCGAAVNVRTRSRAIASADGSRDTSTARHPYHMNAASVGSITPRLCGQEGPSRLFACAKFDDHA